VSRLAFHRPARLTPPPLPDDKIVLPTPPEAEQSQAGSWITLALPLLSSVGMAAYMITFGRPVLIVIGVLFVVVAIGTTVATRAQSRSANRKGSRRRLQRYRAHLATSREYARQVAAAQRVHAALTYPDPQQQWAIAAALDRVWERRAADPDFLRLRVGAGRAPLRTPIQIGARLDPLADYDWDSLRAARRLVERWGTVQDQPAVVDLGSCGVLSILGPRDRAEELTRALLCQIAVLHAPDDVAIAVELSGPGEWEWVKWLPHVIEEDALGPAGVVPLVSEDPAGLAEVLERELLHRQEQAAARRGHLAATRNPRPPRRLVFVCTGFQPVSDWGRSPLLRALLAGAGPALGITLIFLVARETDEPERVDLRLRVTETGRLGVEGRVELVVGTAGDVAADAASPVLAELIARRLAPLRLSDEKEQILARTVSLADMVLGTDPDSADIAARWAEAAGERLLRVPIGNDGEGEPVLLDIKEPAQGGFGPHGLIVGATGSGKSELLRTLITALSLTHPPELLSYVLIDFKGGAAFAPLADLPHVAGLITNLADDAAMVDRAQAALMGEQQRRQRMLRDAGNLDSIREYHRKQAAGGLDAAGRPLQPLPYLLVIVDEFSELLSGRPGIVELFVQMGRVGRSLGIHLLLATQRLEEGRLRGLDSHLSYRICLRTFSAAESRTVIGTHDAYRLPSIPGSAYLKVDESIYQRFRVAHVSSPYVSQADRTEADRVPGDSVVLFAAARPTDGAGAVRVPPEFVPQDTELAHVVRRLSRIGHAVHQVWLPPLPDALPLDHLTGPAEVRPGRGLCVPDWPSRGRLAIPIGLLDLPLQQQQTPLTMDFGGPHGHLAIVGAPQTGRSTALRTILLAGMLTHTPDELQFYCIDLGGGGLHQYENAPHVGSVAGRGDLDRISRTLAEIQTLIAEREAFFRAHGVASAADFRAQRAAGRLPAAHRAADVLLVVDNWGALRTELEQADPIVTDIAARGLGVGVHLVLAASRWVEIRPALRDSIGTRIELRLNDPTESEINRRMSAGMARAVAGRGLAAPGSYFQFVLPRLDGRETADAVQEAQQDTLAKLTAAWAGAGAPGVRMLPDRLSLAEVPASDLPGIPIGIAEADLGPVHLDLAGDEPFFLVYGDAGSGKTGFLRTLAAGIAATSTAWDSRVLLVDYRRLLMEAVGDEFLAAYVPDRMSAGVYIEQLCEQLTQRMPPPGLTPQQLAARSWWQGPLIYLVIDDYDLVGGQVFAPLVGFLPYARDIGLRVVLTRRVTGSGRGGYSDQFVNRIQELGCAGLVLSGDRREGALLGDERAALRPPGRGRLVRRGEPGRLIHVATIAVAQPSAAAGARASG